MRVSPFITIDKRAVIGALKATGSTDLDVLYAARAKLAGAAAVPRWLGIGLALAAIPAGWTRIGWFGAATMLALGWWFLRRGVENVRMVELGYAEHIATVPQRQR